MGLFSYYSLDFSRVGGVICLLFGCYLVIIHLNDLVFMISVELVRSFACHSLDFSRVGEVIYLLFGYHLVVIHLILVELVGLFIYYSLDFNRVTCYSLE